MSMEIVYNHAPATDLDLDDRNREIRTMLHHGVCEVTFTKIDGSMRVMPCTLDPAILPPATVVEGKTPKPSKPDTVSAWCTDKMEWRSFRVANVTKIVRA